MILNNDFLAREQTLYTKSFRKNEKKRIANTDKQNLKNIQKAKNIKQRKYKLIKTLKTKRHLSWKTRKQNLIQQLINKRNKNKN